MIWWPEPEDSTNGPLDSRSPDIIPLCPQGDGRLSGIAARIDTLIDALLAGTAAQRKQAALDLGEMGPAAREAYAALMVALGDRDPEVRWAVGQALAQVPWKGHPPRVLIEGLYDDDPAERSWAILAFGGMRHAPEWIVAETIRLLTDPEWLARVSAADTFMRLVPSPQKASDLLGQVLVTDSAKLIAAEAIWESWSCSPRAAHVATALLLRMDKPGPRAIALARQIIERLRGK